MSTRVLTTLTWLIPALPLLTFFLIVLFTKHNKTLSWLLAWAAIISSLVMGWIVAFDVIGEYFTDLHHLEEHPVIVSSAIDWLPIGGCVATAGNCASWLDVGVAVDPLTAVMLLMVTFAITMIFIYSVGYHNYGRPRGEHFGVPNHGKEEPLLSRFFALMSLFGGAMLILVVADNLLLLFIGWEIMGFCSYSLIGFWYARNYPDPEKITPRAAAVKAFMTTRVADVIMLLGIVFFYRAFGTLNISEALSAASLETAVGVIGPGALGLMTLLLFAGTVGKSAQFPLQVWLPDAMEGPTPVSAVIHAAAMVSAGVYLIVRLFPLIAVALESVPGVSWTIAFIGAFTALMSATIAVAQNDVKGVLAFSTVSQLGFMVAAVGIGAYIAAAFHLITHGFFKALLFLCAGSVIHGMEHGAEHVHDHHTDPQDMRNMGGLRDKMPVTFWTFVIGGMALAGLPFITAGFWSKDEIFADAWTQGFAEGNPVAVFVFVMLFVAALLTAFYTTRQLALTFAGEPRTPLAEHAHESNRFMTWPLVGLSVFAVIAGWAGIPDNFLGVEWGQINFFHHFVGATIHEPMHELHELHLVAHEISTLPWSWGPLISSLFVSLGGIALGWWLYARRPLETGEPDPLTAPLGAAYPFLQERWRFDALYQTVFVRPTKFVSEVIVFEWFDKGAIDGTLHLIAKTVFGIGHYARRFEEIVITGGVDWAKDLFLSIAHEFRYLQTGRIQEYVLISALIAFVLGFVVLGMNYGWFAF